MQKLCTWGSQALKNSGVASDAPVADQDQICRVSGNSSLTVVVIFPVSRRLAVNAPPRSNRVLKARMLSAGASASQRVESPRAPRFSQWLTAPSDFRVNPV